MKKYSAEFIGTFWLVLGGCGSATSRHTIGTGFRYYIARKFGLHSGGDVAWGPERAYVYITVGGAW